jgi:hypothetical protein
MCVEDEEMNKTKKPDFAHTVIDDSKLKNGKGKSKADMIFSVNKISTSDIKHTTKCHNYKKNLDM